MATTTLMFRVIPTQIDTLVIDATISEEHVGDVEVTSHPVEKGANIADHKRVKPETVTITGMVSATPLGTRPAPVAVAGSRAGVDQALSPLRDNPPEGFSGDLEFAKAKLRQLKNSGQLITLLTSIRSYQNMVMTSLRFPKDAKTGHVLMFTATFQEFVFAELQRRTITTNKLPRANKPVKVGPQVTKGADEYSSGITKINDATGNKAREYLGPPRAL